MSGGHAYLDTRGLSNPVMIPTSGTGDLLKLPRMLGSILLAGCSYCRHFAMTATTVAVVPSSVRAACSVIPVCLCPPAVPITVWSCDLLL